MQKQIENKQEKLKIKKEIIDHMAKYYVIPSSPNKRPYWINKMTAGEAKKMYDLYNSYFARKEDFNPGCGICNAKIYTELQKIYLGNLKTKSNNKSTSKTNKNVEKQKNEQIDDNSNS